MPPSLAPSRSGSRAAQQPEVAPISRARRIWEAGKHLGDPGTRPGVLPLHLLQSLEQDRNAEDETSPNQIGSATYGRNLLWCLPCGFDDVPVRIPAFDAHVVRFMPLLDERDPAGDETRPQTVHALRIR